MTNLITQEEWDYWYNKVFGYFYRRVNSRFDAEELTAETLNSFFLTSKKIDDEKSFLWGIARNKLFDHIKNKKKSFANLNSEELENSVQLQSADNYFQMQMQILKNCMSKVLKDVDLQIMDLAIAGDFKSSFIAKELNLSHENVRQRLSRAIKKVKNFCSKFWNS